MNSPRQAKARRCMGEGLAKKIGEGESATQRETGTAEREREREGKGKRRSTGFLIKSKTLFPQNAENDWRYKRAKSGSISVYSVEARTRSCCGSPASIATNTARKCPTVHYFCAYKC